MQVDTTESFFVDRARETFVAGNKFPDAGTLGTDGHTIISH